MLDAKFPDGNGLARRACSHNAANKGGPSYSQPQEQVNIGYVGFADARGWQQIGLDQLDEHERDALHLLGRDES